MSTTLRTIAFGLGFATLGAVTVIGTQAIAQAGQGRGPSQQAERTRMAQGPMGRLGALVQELDLTEDQQARAKQIRADVREIATAQKGDRGEDLEGLMEALQARPADARTVHALIDSRQARRVEMAHSFADAALELWGILDDEQRAIVLDRMDDLDERRGRVRRAMQE